MKLCKLCKKEITKGWGETATSFVQRRYHPLCRLVQKKKDRDARYEKEKRKRYDARRYIRSPKIKITNDEFIQQLLCRTWSWR